MTVTVEIDDRIAKCRKIMEQDPNSQIFAALAEAFRRKGDLDQAFRICQNGLKIHPSYGSAHIVMAKINLDRGLYDWAEAEIRKAAELDGNSRPVELLLAEIHIYKGEFRNAVKLLKRLHEIDPDNSQIRKLLGIALKLPEEKAMTSSISEEHVISGPSGDTELTPSKEETPVALTTSDVLKQAMTLTGLQGALFANVEGLVVESMWGLDLDVTVCGAAFAEIDSFLTQELLKGSFGKGNTVLVETENKIFSRASRRWHVCLCRQRKNESGWSTNENHDPD